jgi:LysR family glycine cleavage system transcriptional activator
MVNLERDGIDLALRRARVESTPPGATPLMDEDVTPVLSPEMRERLGARKFEPRDLLQLPLIDIDTRVPNDPASWRAWFELAGVDSEARTRAGMLFVGYSDQSIQAAVRGQGVALAQSPFYCDLVVSGQLLAPFAATRLITGYRMVLVENAHTRTRPEVRLLRDWILAQFRQECG